MIDELQDAMLKMPQAEIKTEHSFCNGIYSRKITIPKGVSLVGARHKTQFFMIISQGECIIRDGKTTERIKAPYQGVSEIGAKRAIYAVEETILTTFHPTYKTDIALIEKDIIEPEGKAIANNGGRVAKLLG